MLGLKKAKKPFEKRWIPRDQNQLTDALSKGGARSDWRRVGQAQQREQEEEALAVEWE
jgi:hypothetical protein